MAHHQAGKQTNLGNPLLPGSINANNARNNNFITTIDLSKQNQNVTMLPSLKNRSVTDPRHYNSKFERRQLQNISHTHFATGLIPVLGDDIAHGMQRQSRTGSVLEQAHGSQILAVFLLCSMSLGIGVFVLPNILLLIGIGPGILLLFVYAILALFTQLLVLECADITKAKSYEQLASFSLGRFGEFLLAFFMILSLLTGNCGHIQTVGQLLHDIIDWFFTDETEEHHFTWKKTVILYVVMLSLTLPWLFQRSLHGLSGVGTLSVMTVIVTVVSLCIICIAQLANGDGASDAKGNAPVYGFSLMHTEQFWKTDFWRACPTIAFVYTPLLELFPVYIELNHGDVARSKVSVYVSMLICFVIYAVVSVLVIMTYGSDTFSNSLYNVPTGNYWFDFCCFALVIVITLLYPVINYPMINALETILDLFGCCQSKRKENYEVSDEMDEEVFGSDVARRNVSRSQKDAGFDITEWSLLSALITPSIWREYVVYHRREVFSVLFIFVVIAVDIGVTDLADLFGLCGSLGLSFVCYIYPCIIWIISKWKQSQLRKPMILLQLIFAVFVLLFSTAVMVYSTVVIIINII